jgi:hypothetical protein
VKAGPLVNGRISDIVRSIGNPVDQRCDDVPVHRCYWKCGCEAANRRGLCFEDGWALVPCRHHATALGNP